MHQKPDDAFVPAGMEFAWNAFTRLHPCRVRIPIVRTVDVPTVGMGAVAVIGTELLSQKLTFESIDRYARRYEIDGTAFDMLLTILDRLDEAYMTWERDKNNEMRKK